MLQRASSLSRNYPFLIARAAIKKDESAETNRVAFFTLQLFLWNNCKAKKRNTNRFGTSILLNFRSSIIQSIRAVRILYVIQLYQCQIVFKTTREGV